MQTSDAVPQTNPPLIPHTTCFNLFQTMRRPAATLSRSRTFGRATATTRYSGNYPASLRRLSASTLLLRHVPRGPRTHMTLRAPRPVNSSGFGWSVLLPNRLPTCACPPYHRRPATVNAHPGPAPRLLSIPGAHARGPPPQTTRTRAGAARTALAMQDSVPFRLALVLFPEPMFALCPPRVAFFTRPRERGVAWFHHRGAGRGHGQPRLRFFS